MCASRVFKKLLSLEYITEDERLVFLKLHYSTVLLILFFFFLFSCGPNFFFWPKTQCIGNEGLLVASNMEIQNQFYCKYLQKKGLLSVWANQHFENTTKKYSAVLSSLKMVCNS